MRKRDALREIVMQRGAHLRSTLRLASAKRARLCTSRLAAKLGPLLSGHCRQLPPCAGPEQSCGPPGHRQEQTRPKIWLVLPPHPPRHVSVPYFVFVDTS